MNRFTVEETNLISIYIADTRRELIGEMTKARRTSCFVQFRAKNAAGI